MWPQRCNRIPPSQVRIRAGNGNEHRYEAIELTADFYDCNKTKAVVAAWEDIPDLVAAAQTVLARKDLTIEQRREIADTFALLSLAWLLATARVGLEGFEPPID